MCLPDHDYHCMPWRLSALKFIYVSALLVIEVYSIVWPVFAAWILQHGYSRYNHYLIEQVFIPLLILLRYDDSALLTAPKQPIGV